MPFDCQHRVKYGRDICLTDCLSTAEHGGCEYARVEPQAYRLAAGE